MGEKEEEEEEVGKERAFYTSRLSLRASTITAGVRKQSCCTRSSGSYALVAVTTGEGRSSQGRGLRGPDAESPPCRNQPLLTKTKVAVVAVPKTKTLWKKHDKTDAAVQPADTTTTTMAAEREAPTLYDISLMGLAALLRMRNAPRENNNFGEPANDQHPALPHLCLQYLTEKRNWGDSEERRRLLADLESKKPQRGWQVREAICFGTGSFMRAIENRCPRSMRQFCMFIDMVDYLGAHSDGRAAITAQDKECTEVDLSFLRLSSIEGMTTPFVTHYGRRVEGPTAFDRITPSSFVCELGVIHDRAFLERLMETRPKLILGSMLPDTTCMEGIGETIRQ